MYMMIIEDVNYISTSAYTLAHKNIQTLVNIVIYVIVIYVNILCFSCEAFSD